MLHSKPLLSSLPLLGCLLLGACGGGGGGAAEVIVVKFSQAGNCTGNEPNLVLLSLGAVDQQAGTFQLLVDATLSDPAVGAAFWVTYDPSVLKFVKYVPDPGFLAGGVAAGQPLAGVPGTAAVGISRLAGAPGASGAVPLGRLVFRRLTDDGLSAIGFTQDFLADAASSFPSPLAACWGGGQVEIRKQ